MSVSIHSRKDCSFVEYTVVGLERIELSLNDYESSTFANMLQSHIFKQTHFLLTLSKLKKFAEVGLYKSEELVVLALGQQFKVKFE